MIRLLVLTIGFLGTLLFSVRINSKKRSSISSNRSNSPRGNSSSSNRNRPSKVNGIGDGNGPEDVILILLMVLFAVVVVVEVGRVVTCSSASCLFVGFWVVCTVPVACRLLALVLVSCWSTVSVPVGCWSPDPILGSLGSPTSVAVPGRLPNRSIAHCHARCLIHLKLSSSMHNCSAASRFRCSW
jgi:hypothetical protein